MLHFEKLRKIFKVKHCKLRRNFRTYLLGRKRWTVWTAGGRISKARPRPSAAWQLTTRRNQSRAVVRCPKKHLQYRLVLLTILRHTLAFKKTSCVFLLCLMMLLPPPLVFILVLSRIYHNSRLGEFLCDVIYFAHCLVYSDKLGLNLGWKSSWYSYWWMCFDYQFFIFIRSWHVLSHVYYIIF